MSATLAIVAVSGPLRSQATPARAATPVPVVLELFTSEGCSSCPPADRLLIELITTQPVKNAVIIGLSEHVDYWNNFGWKDPFSDHLFSVRQSAYASAAGSGDVYTPQLVVDGRESFVGSDRAAALAAIARAAATPKLPLALGWTSTMPRKLTVEFAGGASNAGAIVLLAVVEDGLSNDVRSGENSGRHLAHDAVTRKLVEIGRADRNGTFASAGLRVDLNGRWNVTKTRLVAIAQTERSHRVIGAGWITP